MSKKSYILPQMEIVSIETPRIMDSSMNTLPPQPVIKRRTEVF